jgi:predicted  nucleic acid-binding Zn-ribbon protein
MKTVCLTGMPGSDLHTLEQYFHAAGVQPARAAERTQGLDINKWHDHVAGELKALQVPETALTPGRMWEQMAGEIFVANLEQPLWGWSDPRSTWLLDYWAEFEPQISFVLLCSRPEFHLARLIEEGQDPSPSPDIEAFTAGWLAYHEALLRFHHKYPARTLLFNAETLVSRPGVDAVMADILIPAAHKLGFPIPESFSPSVTTQPPGALARYVAHTFLAQENQVHALWREIEATMPEAVLPAAESDQSEDEDNTPSLSGVIENIRALQDRSAEEDTIETLQHNLQQREEQIATLQKKAQDDSAQLDKERHAAAAREKDLQQLRTELEQKQARLSEQESKNRETTEENELILLQLHQVQEELESTFLSKTELEKKIAELQKQAQDSAKRIEQQQKSSQQTEAALQKAKQELEQKQTRLKEQESKISALQEELESTFLSKTELEKKIAELQKQAQDSAKRIEQQQKTSQQTEAALQKAKQELEQKQAQLKEQESKISALQKEAQSSAAQLDKERQAAAAREKDLQQLRTELEQKQARLSELESKNRETTEENELILLQLHQVQEELERYFLEHQQAQEDLRQAQERFDAELKGLNAEKQQMQARWQRLQERIPDYCDYARVDVVEREDMREDATIPDLKWRFEEVQLGARFFPRLEFETFVQGTVAGVRFRRDPAAEDEGVLLHWPEGADPEHADIIPVANNSAEAATCAAMLRSLSTSDWNMLKGIAPLCRKILTQAAQDVISISSKTIKAHVTGLTNLDQLLQRFPAALRFDAVNLEAEHKTEGYEHLSLNLKNLAIGDNPCGDFTFRLACANVAAEAFGTDPRLQFPAAEGQQVFESWFEESCDELGSRLELRFALPDAIDLDVLTRLSEADRKTLQRLVNNLPSILRMVEEQGDAISRPWAHWHDTAADVGRILALYADALPTPASEEPPQTGVGKQGAGAHRQEQHRNQAHEKIREEAGYEVQDMLEEVVIGD